MIFWQGPIAENNLYDIVTQSVSIFYVSNKFFVMIEELV